jgi:hypothetical protein
LPNVRAHDPPQTVQSYAYVVATPNPVGVGQTTYILMWIDNIPVSASGIGGDRWTNYTIDITKPNGQTEHFGPFVSDPTSSYFIQYTPDQVGNYNIKFTFPGQVASLYNPVNGLPGSNSEWINDTFLGSTAQTTLTVQQTQIEKIPEPPLPTGYWTRPIDGQNTDWYSIASNWLGGEGGSNPTYNYNIQPEGAAPETAHIMWTRPLQDGGVVGGSNYAIKGITYYEGDSYEMKFNNPLIIQGRLYYPLPLSNDVSGGGYICVDLRTGKQVWYSNEIGVSGSSSPSFGQVFDYETFNQHGAMNGYLWQTQGTTWKAYDAFTGQWLFTLTNVPNGINEYGEYGEIVRYILNPNNQWLALWNNTQHNVGLELSMDTSGGITANAYEWRPIGKTVNMSAAYTWNVTLSESIPSGSSVYYVIPNDMLLATTPQVTNTFSAYGTLPYTVSAISLKAESLETVLWSQTYTPPSGNLTRQLGPVDPVNRVFTTIDKETMQWSGYSMDSGNKLWGPLGDERALQFYSSRSGGGGSQQSSAYGILYDAGFGGIVYAYDTRNGNLLWTYGNGGEGNSTNSGLETVWGNYPTFIGALAEGKLYLFTQEHSINSPIYKDARIRCLNATSGKELWTLPAFAVSTNFYSRIGAIADGYLAYLNGYDNQVYVVGKGPSATTVSAPLTSVNQGQGIVITGSVSDVSAGAKQKVSDGLFTIIPAVSDQSVSKWMEYIYMQKPIPTDATGVPVHITAIDPNNNYQDIGYTTTDTNGNYGYMWTPPVPGMYKIVATFEGSNAYGPSSASTYIGVQTASPQPSVTQTPPEASPTTPTTTTPTSTAPAETSSASPTSAVQPPPGNNTPIVTYVAIAAAVIIILAAATALVLRRRK